MNITKFLFPNHAVALIMYSKELKVLMQLRDNKKKYFLSKSLGFIWRIT